MPKEKTTEQRNSVISKLISVFRQYGYEGATLSRLSQATGLRRSSLYHHFPKGKEQMAAEVLEYVNDWFEKTVLIPLQTDDEPHQKLQIMCDNLNNFYHQGKENCLLNVISLGEGNDLFHSNIKHSLVSWIEAIAKVLICAGIKPDLAHLKAQEAIMLIQGGLVLARGLDDTKPFQQILATIPERLLEV